MFSAVLLGVLVFGGIIFDGRQVHAASEGYISQLITSYQQGGLSGLLGAQDEDEYGMTNRVGIHGVGNGEYSAPSTDFDVLLVDWASNFLKWVVSAELYEEVFFSSSAREGVTQAWEAVRGFVNMFYLLILVFLAITTILQINKFNDKKLFFNVIISAILVNFSMAITLVVIDFSNLIMVYFASAIQEINTANSFFDDMGYVKAFGDGKGILRTGVGMAQFIVNIVLAVMLFFVGISLLIRLIAYWVLIILSPLAFFSIAMPGSSGFNEWKDKLLHYSFYGPIMLFFIWLALALSKYLDRAFLEANDINGWDSFVKFLTSYITVLYLLYYGHDKSTSMAKKAGDFAGKIMDKGGQYAVKAGKGAGILATGGLPLVAKSGGEAVYTGAKTNLMDSKVGRMMFSDGRKKAQEDRNRKMEYKMAGGHKKERMEMEDLAKKEKEMKGKYGDLDNVKNLEKIAEIGTEDEKKVAYAKLAQIGKLKGENFEKAMRIGDENELYKNVILKGAEKKSKYELMKYRLAESRINSEESQEYIKNNIKGMLNEGEDLDEFVTAQYEGNYRAAVVGGMISSTGNTDDIAKIINESTEMAEYANTHYSGFGRAQLTDKRKDVFSNKLNEKSRAALRGSLVGGGEVIQGVSSRQGGGPRVNPAGGNFNGPDLS